MLRSHISAATLYLLLFAAFPARAAEPSAVSRADALFTEGRQLIAGGKVDEACLKFAESYGLDPAVGTLINLASCEEKQQRVLSAWKHWEEAVKRLSADDKRLPLAKEHATALGKRLPRLTIKLAAEAPQGTVVKRDGAVVPAAAMGAPQLVEPGAHTVEVIAEGREPARQLVAIAEGESKAVEAALGPPLAPAPMAVPVAAVEAKAAPRATAQIAGFVTGGLGLGALVAAAVTGTQVLEKRKLVQEHCPGRACDAAGMQALEAGRTLTVVTNVLWVAGGVAVGAGAALVVVGSMKPATPKVALMPAVGPGHAGMTLVGEF
ncbi:MAG: hypothetical protein HY901_34175 [Deltaproteobacteria bacterium]|nr:hypothetical protein [Deltaproteobacteria bacterium]